MLRQRSLIFPLAISVGAQVCEVFAVQSRSHHGGELSSLAHFSPCSTPPCDSLHNGNSADSSIFSDALHTPELAALVAGLILTIFGASSYMQHSKLHVFGRSTDRLLSRSVFVSLCMLIHIYRSRRNSEPHSRQLRP